MLRLPRFENHVIKKITPKTTKTLHMIKLTLFVITACLNALHLNKRIHTITESVFFCLKLNSDYQILEKTEL